MATTTYYMSPITLLVQLFNNLGLQLAGGFVYTYVAGSTTAQTTYTDSTGTTANSNPIPLSSAGRLQTAGGAPTTVWVAQGITHKMVITDSSGNFIIGIDNLTSLSDPTTILNLLATATSTSSNYYGADLIANAMRSYAVIANVRAAPVPTLGTGQTLVIDVEGGSLVNDGGGGLFYWSATSTATDDGVNTIKPTALTTSQAGRYLRQSNLYGVSGSFTLAANTGFTTTPTMLVHYVQNGNQVTLTFPGITGTSNATTLYLSGFSNGLQGVSNASQSPLLPAEDNSALGVSSYWTIPNQTGGSTVTVSINNASGNWTSSGTKALLSSSFSYVTS